MTSPPTDLLFLIYDLERGGPEMRLLDFARYFPEDLRVNICATTNRVSLFDQFKACNTNVMVLPIRKGYLEFHKANQIYNLMKRCEISILNAFGLKELMISVMIRAKSPYSTKAVYHLVDLLHDSLNHHRLLLRGLLPFTNACICNSMQSQRILKSLSVPEKKITVIENGIDLRAFERQGESEGFDFRKKLGIAPHDMVLGTVANFRKVKNYPFLLKAFQILSHKHPRLRLLCVGGGPDLGRIRDLAREYGVMEKTIFPGYSDEIATFLQSMNIFALCSLKEGFPNAVLQAMSMEVPVICSDVGGCPEIISSMDNGILFPPNDQQRFMESVEMLLKDKDLANRLGRAGRKTVEEKFSLNRMIDAYATFYRNMAIRAAKE